MAQKLMRIGEVAAWTGLSLRTIRHDEEVGVLAPSRRTAGGFRLDTEAGGPLPATTGEAHEELVTRLRRFWLEADARCEDLRGRLQAAGDFARSLHAQLAKLLDTAPEGTATAR